MARKNMDGVHPDRSGHMQSYPVVSHHEKMKSSKQIRSTPEGQKLAEEWSKNPYSVDREDD